MEFRGNPGILIWLPSFRSFGSCTILENSIYYPGFLIPEAVAQMCSVKKVFLEISQNSQEKTCARVSFLIKFLKKRFWHRCFTVSFAKFLRTPFLQNISGGCFCGSCWSLPSLQLGWVGLMDTGLNWKPRVLSSIFSREISKIWAWKYLLCVQQKSSGFLFFLILFSATCSKYGVFQSLVITFPKRILFFLFLFTSGIKLFKLIDTTRRAFRFFEFFLQIKLL